MKYVIMLIRNKRKSKMPKLGKLRKFGGSVWPRECVTIGARGAMAPLNFGKDSFGSHNI